MPRFRDYIRRVSQAADDWALYAAHRARFSAALLSCAPATSGRLCILGAGKCNDVDLEQLVETFSEIHLVDIDPSAVAAATARQTASVRARLRPHAPVDLAGLSHKRLAKWQRKSPTRSELAAYEAAALASITSRLPGPFDVVASACILTQMSFSLREALGERHAMLVPIRGSVMATHLNSLVALTAVGGKCLFSCDLVSSSAYPPLKDVMPDTDLSAVMRDIVAQGASYFAANPKLIKDILQHDPRLAESAGEAEQLEPWLWTGPFERTYLVYALRFERL
jgi:hypothetical protein